MNAFFLEIIRIAKLLASDPSSSNEIMFIWLSILVTSTVTVIVMGKTLRSTLGHSIPRGAVVALIGPAVLLASIAVANLYLVPMAGSSSIRGLFPGALVIIAIAGVAAPACLWLHKTKYSKAMVTVLLSIVVSAGAVMVIRSSFTGARNSKASAMKMKSKTEQAGKLLK